MTIQVQGPDGAIVEFPDGTDNAVMESAMKAHYGTQDAAAPAQPAKPQTLREMAMPPMGAPLFDYLGDTGRAFSSSLDSLKTDFNKALPSAKDQLAQDTANREEYGNVLGTAKSALLDPVMRTGNALRVPLDLLGMASSPITGAIHAGPGSLVAQLPFMDKPSADKLIDKSMMGIAPKGGSFQGIANAADATAAANAQETLAANAAKTAQNPAFAQAREAGYVVHPADAVPEPGGPANTLAGIGGKIKTQQLASVKNQEVTNGIAARELGLPADATLDDATFNTVRANAANAYKTIENSASGLPTGRIVADNTFLTDIADLDAKSADFVADFPEAAAKRSEGVKEVQDMVLKNDFAPKSGVEMIRHLRNESRTNLKAWDDADKLRLGAAQRDAAQAIEDLIERNLTAAGNPQAVADYQSARQLIAKSHDVEAVTDAAGNVDARKLAALGNKRPLTGGLKTIADVAERFPKSMQVPSKFGGHEKHSVLSTLAGVASLATGHPLIALGALFRPFARAKALSPGMQDSLLGLRPLNQSGTVLKQSLLPAYTGQNLLGLPSPDLPPLLQEEKRP